VLNRLDNIASSASPGDSDKFAAFTHLGDAAVVEVKYPAVTASGNPLALVYGSAGTYGGFDRFGRIVD
jgi:hypothetical protein